LEIKPHLKENGFFSDDIFESSLNLKEMEIRLWAGGN